MTLLLASRSAARRHMLTQAGVAFEAVDAPLDEEEAKAHLLASGLDARRLAEALASAKALSVAAPAEVLVLGSDQVLELEDGRMLNKPRSQDEAAEQLRALSGRSHRLHSAAVLIQGGAEVWLGCQSVRLSVRPLTEAFIASYLHAEYQVIRWSVGGYRIEGPGVQLFDRIEGSHFAILGLPLLPLLAELRRRGLMQR